MAVLRSRYKQILSVVLVALLPLGGCGGSGSSSGSVSSTASSDFTLSIADQMTVENCSICHEFKNHDWAGCGDPVWEEEHKAVIICPQFNVPEESTDDPASVEDPTVPSDGSGNDSPSAPKKPKKSPPPSGSTCGICHVMRAKPSPDNCTESWTLLSPAGHAGICSSPPPKKKKPNKKSLNGWGDVKDLALFLNGKQGS